MKLLISLLLFVLAMSSPSFADSLIPNPTGPEVFDDLIGKTISLKCSKEYITDLYWEVPDTIWIKRVKRPKIYKHYYIERSPYHGTLSDDREYAPIDYNWLTREPRINQHDKIECYQQL